MLWDYIFVGGGLSAAVTSNRLLHHHPALKILVIEAGANANNDPSGRPIRLEVQNVPQVHLNNRQIDLPCGKALGGGTVINVGGWSRGAKRDYDLWAETVGDDRWSYDGLLPYFRETERVANASINPQQHGGDGPVYIQGIISTERQFPLREKVLDSWKDVGVNSLPFLDGNAGEPNGVGDLFENRREGRRQIASVVYPLDGISVLTETLVAKVLLEPNANSRRPHRAVGVQLANGTEIKGKDVILSAGAIRTPQVLMLSGIGPPMELAKHNITPKVISPDVGQHLVDHGLFPVQWKLKDPSAGYAIGSGNLLFKKAQYGWGIPADFLVSAGVGDKEGLAKAIEEDEGSKPDLKTHPLLNQERTFNEYIVVYAGLPDGSTISSLMVHLLPTSRGSVTLASSDIKDAPLVDPNYYATAVDRFVARDGMRRLLAFALGQTPLGRYVVDGDAGALGFDAPFGLDSTDDYIDKRFAAALGSTHHPMGTAAMGKVVDNKLRVKGVAGLSVVDASVFPVAITAHLQVATYAMANLAADILYRERECKTRASGNLANDYLR
ncbi:glucose dehydrogenase, putative [Cordyceps militaris CM01]|uniref:Glucose dehydrogenase, putative n=1 Tax=Cordyceps militaris (strain CM01) TaxID=983644 RepID=G3JD30_CORMM|nr:glucose dehydrogenase, putative [Cordyceps militaris CM01]EGX93356.1 glucose dehydrogenase, putative [Cordyceps militaris CM01]